jgi:hypothetical protein
MKGAIMEKHGTKQIAIGYRVRDNEGIYRFVWKQDMQSAIPVHAPEGFDPIAFGRELALEDKQKLREEITGWRRVRQHVVDRSLSQGEELALVDLVQLWLDDLMSQPCGESL